MAEDGFVPASAFSYEELEMPYLKHKETGEVYPLNEHLLKRGDFIEVQDLNDELPKPELEEFVIEPAPKAKPKAKRKSEPKAEPVAVEPEPAPEVEDVDVSDLLADLPEDFGED